MNRNSYLTNWVVFKINDILIQRSIFKIFQKLKNKTFYKIGKFIITNSKKDLFS